MARNRVRDRQADDELKAEGWTVFRIWEHDIDSFNIGDIAEAVGQSLARLAYR